MPNMPEHLSLSLATGQNGYVEAYFFKRGDVFNWNGLPYLKVRWMQNFKGWRLDDARLERVPTARPWRGHIYWWEFWQSWADNGFSGAFFRVMNFCRRVGVSRQTGRSSLLWETIIVGSSSPR